MTHEQALIRRVHTLEKRSLTSAGRRLVDGGLIVSLISFALPWPGTSMVPLLVGFVCVVVPGALTGGVAQGRQSRLLAALPCVGLLLGLFLYGVRAAEGPNSEPAAGPLLLMIGMFIVLAGIAWSRAERRIERTEAAYWASVNRSR